MLAFAIFIKQNVLYNTLSLMSYLYKLKKAIYIVRLMFCILSCII